MRLAFWPDDRATHAAEIDAFFSDKDDGWLTLVAECPVEKAAAEAAFLAACDHAESKYGIPPKVLHETVRRRLREFAGRLHRGLVG